MLVLGMIMCACMIGHISFYVLTVAAVIVLCSVCLLVYSILSCGIIIHCSVNCIDCDWDHQQTQHPYVTSGNEGRIRSVLSHGDSHWEYLCLPARSKRSD